MKRGPWKTKRWLNRTLVWHDRKHHRYVISRRANGITRKTSRRYSPETAFQSHARLEAMLIAARLKSHPAHKLASFVF